MKHGAGTHKRSKLGITNTRGGKIRAKTRHTRRRVTR